MFLLEVITVLLILNTALFIHELGHAIPLLLRNKKAKAEIYLGAITKENKLKLRLGRLTCYLAIAFSGRCVIGNPDELPPATHKQNLLFSAGGPLASLIAFIALLSCSYFIAGVPGIILNRIAFVSLSVFFFTIIPITYPSFMQNLGGQKSDGIYILNDFKEMKKEAKAVS
ncbi:hypothetical protein [Planococcus halotolerans]|uniref:Peptidase M50 domain-containing protein n=1 Tax=Planococcus halotolerans TaxID=2233542 RepID=A0A365KX70_9BACL|nr:hypothetical protein [Planococcus halotolerans]QHJ72229.1 hypothetical protein DNR44_017190 [Planococcus halotolerans]RAZ77754.1 hypothetical protein DP120_09745 [Planococcus halotolerans]